MNMIPQTKTLLAIAAVVFSASSGMAQYSSTPYQCPDGQCSLNSNAGYQLSNGSYLPNDQYPERNPYLQDRYSYPDSRYGQPAYNPGNDNSSPVTRSSPNSYPSLRDELRNRFDEFGGLPGQRTDDYRSRLNDVTDNSFRRPIFNDYRNPGRELANEYGSFSSDGRTQNHTSRGQRTGNRGRLQDPFRLPNYDEAQNDFQYQNAPLSRDDRTNTNFERRYRIPVGAVDYTTPQDRYAPVFDDKTSIPGRSPADFSPLSDYRAPSTMQGDRMQPGYDPLTPPLPRRGDGSEAEAIFDEISARYGNPVNVRSVQAMTSSTALQLYREVSQQTDQRHLEPSSYDLRVRRGIRNIGLALENPTFVRSLGITPDSFQVDGFRTTLSRIAEQMRVADAGSAQNVVQTVMYEAQNVPGLSPNVVAFEFANATIDTLDKFSALEPKEPGRGASMDLQQAERIRTAGLESEIVGVGVEVKLHENGLLIMKALRGGPAAEAGLQSGDVITAIDRQSIMGMPMANSVDLMKGNTGSSMALQIARNGSRPINVTLVRRRIQIYTVNDARILPNSDKVAYLSLSQFGAKSTEELDQALNQMYNSGMQSLILDLRGNPGGLLNVCVEITNRFLPCGTIVSTRGRLSSDNMLETATFERTWSTPIVVLIDGDSASASEIFAAAIQDNKRGVVVGEKSYGKGTVQTHFPLSSISGNLRLTTARFYSPNGKAMSGQGVTPDVRIADADGPVNGDQVLKEALKIAQSQRLRDIAQAAKQCRPSASAPVQRNSFNQDLFDMVSPKTVMQ